MLAFCPYWGSFRSFKYSLACHQRRGSTSHSPVGCHPLPSTPLVGWQFLPSCTRGLIPAWKADAGDTIHLTHTQLDRHPFLLASHLALGPAARRRRAVCRGSRKRSPAHEGRKNTFGEAVDKLKHLHKSLIMHCTPHLEIETVQSSLISHS